MVNRKNPVFAFSPDKEVAELIRELAQRNGLTNKRYLENLVIADSKNYIVCPDCGALVVDARVVSGEVNLTCPACGGKFKRGAA